MPKDGGQRQRRIGLITTLAAVEPVQSSVELHGACRPRLYLANGELWVGKRLSAKRWRAELLGSLLGQEIEVPVPAVGLCDSTPDAVYSAWQGPPTHWARGLVEFADNYEALGGALALDALIGNDDRNPRNILLQPLERHDDAHMFSLHFIDHEGSLAGDLPSFRGLGNRARPGALPPDYPTDQTVVSAALAAAERASELSATRVAAIVSIACGRDSAAIQTQFVDALSDRLEDAGALAEAYLQKVQTR